MARSKKIVEVVKEIIAPPKGNNSPLDREALKNYVKANASRLFDRDPALTGNVDVFVDGIINLMK